MKTLLIKDILCQKKLIIFSSLYSLIFFIGYGLIGESVSASFVIILSSFACSLMITFGSFKSDINDTPVFLLSLPLTKTRAVQEKFILMFAGALLGLASSSVFCLIFGIPAIGWSHGWLTFRQIITIIGIIGIFSFFLPLYFRFGQLAVRYAIIGLLVLGVFLQIIFAVGLTLFDTNLKAGISFIFEKVFSMNADYARLAVFLAGISVLLVSYLISLKVYKKKDL